jgi:hypothetical protein
MLVTAVAAKLRTIFRRLGSDTGRFSRKKITLIKLKVKKSSGNDTSSKFLIVTPETFEIMVIVKKRFRNSRYVFGERKIRIKYDVKITSRFGWKTYDLIRKRYCRMIKFSKLSRMTYEQKFSLIRIK